MFIDSGVLTACAVIFGYLFDAINFLLTVSGWVHNVLRSVRIGSIIRGTIKFLFDTVDVVLVL